MSRLLALTALLAGLALAGCQRTAYYRMSPEDARNALAGSVIPDFAFGKTAHTTRGEVDGDSVVWSLRSGADGFEDVGDAATNGVILKLVAKVEPAPGGAAVTTDLAPADGVDPAGFSARLASRPGSRRLLRDIAAEQVDAQLNHRAFRFEAISGDIALAVAASLPEIRRQADAAASAAEDRDRDAIDRAYEHTDHTDR